jgi:hypothetical protein
MEFVLDKAWIWLQDQVHTLRALREKIISSVLVINVSSPSQ